MKAWINNRLANNPLGTFTLVSLMLIATLVAVSGYTQSRFFEDALIDREAEIVKQTVVALALHELHAEDFDDYTSAASQQRFERGFSALKNVPEVVRLKLYNSDNIIVWSDAKELVGKYLPKTDEHLARVWAGIPSGVFDPTKRLSHAKDPLPNIPLVEFYIPLKIKKRNAAEGEIKAVVAVYRSAQGMTDTLRHGMLLLWLVTINVGIVLFLALYHLFRKVYYRKREVENKFFRLSTEHDRIVQMEKLSVMGRMVGEIAHQFNNPLVGVVNLAQLAEREADNPERARELLREIRKAGEHCSDFVQRMLRFTQFARSEPQPTEIASQVRDTIDLISHSTAVPPRLEFTGPDSEVVLRVDPVLLRHAVFNLIKNATQAAPEGTIRICLYPEQHGGSDGWAIAVSDRGPGLSPGVMKQLFTPFYTTRPNGTGLGLTVAQHIVIQHDGHLRAENNPDGGARFVIWLPAHAKGVAARWVTET